MKTSVLTSKLITRIFGLIFFGFTLFFSKSSEAQFAPSDDFDTDGIINSIDIDDDNDGILDAIEAPNCFYTSTEANAIQSITSQFTSPDAFTTLYDGLTTLVFNFAAGSMSVGNNIFTITYPTSVPLSSVTVSHNITATTAARARLYGSNDGINFTDLSGTNIAISTTPIVFNVLINAGNYKYYKIQNEVAGTLTTANTIGEITSVMSTNYITSAYPKASCTEDTDGDLVLNQFDLDSDGDGCSDAFEGGATNLVTPNYSFVGTVGANGFINSLETGIDNGIINYSSTYAFAIDNAHNHCNLFESVSGKVFMDFDGSSTQSSHLQEPGVKNVTVRAYKPDGSFVDAITDSLGEYTFIGSQLPGGTKVRLEFINLPNGFHDGFTGSGSQTTVQFVTAGSNANNASLALSLPGHFSSTLNPKFVVAKFKRNNEATTLSNILILDSTGSRNSNPPTSTIDNSYLWALSTLATGSGANVSNYPIPAENGAATTAEVGSVMGMAWNKQSKKLLVGSYMRAFASMGTNTSSNGYGEGIIYQIPIAGAVATTPTIWLDLETLLGDGVAGTFIPDGAHPGPAVYGRTGLNPNKIGYTGLGSLKMSADGSQLYVVNLNQLEVLVIPIDANGAAPTSASAIKRFPLPTVESPGAWSGGRPQRSVLGLGVHPVTGRVYATLTCNGPAVGNLKGIVYSFDPSDNTPDVSDFVKELEIPMNIIRPATQTNQNNFWDLTNHAWEDVTANSVFYSNGAGNVQTNQHTQPWLGEIIFDALPDGTFGMVIAERNRFHDLTNGSWFVAGAVMYRATFNSTTWVLENNGVAGPLQSTVNWTFSAANRAGSNTSSSNRFFKYVGVEGSFVFGMLEHVPGTNEVMLPAQDNVSYSATHGIAWLNTTNGQRARDTRLLSNATAAGFDATSFTKSNNWGDIEMLGDLPSIEIGDRVWLDTDQDGIQDPDENGIAGVTVELYKGGILVGTTTTNANGLYYFTQTNVVLNGANGLLPLTNYEISILGSQAPLSTYMLTGTNTDASSNGDARDNDGSGSSTAVISITTGKLGENNYTYDFGYYLAPVCAPPFAGNDTTVCGITCMNLTGTSPSTGTWFAQSSNPLGATLGATTAGVAQVCFAANSSGSYHFIYNIGGSCEDTMTLIVTPQGSIGNYVWYDSNGNGIADETVSSGINGIQVELWKETTNGSGVYQLDQSTTTANNISSNPGYYEFHVCETANYKVKFPLSSGGQDLTKLTITSGTDNNSDANSTTGFSPSFNINVNSLGIAKDNPTIDAGYYKPACLGNYVWNDLNKDGVQNTNEVGVAGITVTLLNSSNTVLSTTLTDAYGYYRFKPLTPGNYHVGFTLPANYVFTSPNSNNDSTDSDVNPSSGITGNYTLAVGDSNMTVDAGIYFQQPITASVGNYVWLDVNQDGIQDPNEKGISGVTVTLCNVLGNVIATTITDANGYYQFTNVTPGTYSVGFTQPAGLLFSPNNGAVTNPSNSDANPLTGKTSTFVVNAGDDITTIDAGLYSQTTTLGGLGDKVWYDINQDGIQDADELGVQGVIVTLYEADGITVISTTTTDAFGNYIFNNLSQGQYIVGFSNLPIDYVFTNTNGTDSTTNSDANTASGKSSLIQLAQGQFNMSIDAGIHTNNVNNTNSLGNYVWYDVNKNGIQEATELGVPGVTVTLYNSSNVAIDVTSTDANGLYLFPDLPNGSYHVGFTNIPLGYVFSPQAQGTSATDSDPDPSTGLTTSVSLTGNTHDRSLDAGINLGNTSIGKATLGDLVWYDLNNDGLQNPGETGVAGVTVTLFGADGTTVIATTITDALGNYIFTGLDAGNYIVGFTNLPSGFTISPKNSDSQGINGESNSDVDPTTQKTDLISLAIGEDKMSVDMGITPPAGTASLGNFVWFDLNNDGLQTSGEPGVQGVTVTLFDGAGNDVGVTTTDANGEYYFIGLNPGAYYVNFSNLPTGYTFTTENANATGIDGALNSDANMSNGMTDTVTLAIGDNNLHLDAGIVSNIVASVGDYVWFDINHNGLQDPTETPIGGALVTLYNSSNTPVASAITKPDGGYIFTNVTPGTYHIGFSNTPTNMEFTIQETNPVSNTGSNPNPLTGMSIPFTVLPGTHTPTIDAGLSVPLLAGLGNYVWIDLNFNGLQDATEPAVAGVLVTLYAADGTTVLATAVTNGEGAYSFTNLDAGTYIVGFTNLPINYVPTMGVGVLNDPLNNDMNAGNGKTNPVTLVAGEYNPNIDAGIYLNQTFPINLRDFSVIEKNCNVELNWHTDNELNSSYFAVLRKSEKDNQFREIGRVKAAGNSNSIKAYRYTDTETTNGTWQYQLNMVDVDTKLTQSDIQATVVSCLNQGVKVYPNPVNETLNVTIHAETSSLYTIKLIDMTGRVIVQTETLVDEKVKTVSFNLQHVASGTYQLQVQHESVSEVFSILKSN